MSGVILQKVTKRFGDVEVIHGVDLHIEPGEFCVFVGPSGCGKSTLLRMVSGLEDISEGKIFIAKRNVTKVDAAERGIAMVFQTYALYPHMTVEENMGFGLKMNGVSKLDIKARVNEVAEILKLEPYMKRKPKALSGGQRQRVAIGRALVRNPQVFLFDEPLSNLDAELRVEMRVEISRLHQQIGATMIYVTHDQVEAMTLADKIVVLRAGYVEQVGTPMDIYNNPANQFVAKFIGSPSMNFIEARLQNGSLVSPILGVFSVPSVPNINKNIVIGLRPEHLKINPEGDYLTIELVERLGGVNYFHALGKGGEKLVIEHKGVDLIHPGDTTGVEFDPAHLYVFDKETEQNVALT